MKQVVSRVAYLGCRNGDILLGIELGYITDILFVIVGTIVDFDTLERPYTIIRGSVIRFREAYLDLSFHRRHRRTCCGSTHKWISGIIGRLPEFELVFEFGLLCI